MWVRGARVTQRCLTIPCGRPAPVTTIASSRVAAWISRTARAMVIGTAVEPDLSSTCSNHVALRFGDLAGVRRVAAVRRPAALARPERREQIGQSGLRVADQPDLDRVVLADLARIDVELDELRRRDVERDAGPVRRGRPVGEPVADRDDDVGRDGQLVARRRCGVADGQAGQLVESRRSRPCRSRSSRPAPRAVRRGP